MNQMAAPQHSAGQPCQHCRCHRGGKAGRGEHDDLQAVAARIARYGVLAATVTGHGAPLAMMLIIVMLLIGAGVSITLVSLTRRDDPVEAIRAAAEVLAALLPWPGKHRASGGHLAPARKPRGIPGSPASEELASYVTIDETYDTAGTCRWQGCRRRLG